MSDVVLESVASQGAVEIKSFIAQVETLAKQAAEKVGVAQVPITHHFSKDIYAREMKMKPGELVVGKIHRFEQLNIISEGEVSILSIDGLLRVKAPYTFVGSVGAKRLIYAHTNVTWTVIHGTAERDLIKIEETFIAKNYEDVLPMSARPLELKGE